MFHIHLSYYFTYKVQLLLYKLCIQIYLAICIFFIFFILIIIIEWITYAKNKIKKTERKKICISNAIMYVTSS